MEKLFTSLFLLLFFACNALAQAGALLNAFSGDGKLVTDFGGNDRATAVTVLPNGRIVATGYKNFLSTNRYDIATAHYNSNGSLFSKNTPHDDGSSDVEATAIALRNGNTIIAGFSKSGIPSQAKYNFLINGEFGTMITDFGADDKAFALAVQSDGKIIVAGRTNIRNNPSFTYSEQSSSYDFAIVRYNSNGTVDNTFGKKIIGFGGWHNVATAIAIQSDGKILVAGYTNPDPSLGYDFAILRYNSNGTLDNSFSGDGKVTTDFGGDDRAKAIAIQSDGKIVVAGEANPYVWLTPSLLRNDYDFGIVRYNINGTLDNSFDGDGKVLTDFTSGQPYGRDLTTNDDRASCMVIQNNGKILVAGHAEFANTGYDFAMARYNSNGSLDNSFDFDGKVITDIRGNYQDKAYGIALLGNVIYVAGESAGDFAVTAYQNDLVILPVTLLNFSATKNGSQALIQWTTTVEQNTSHFELEYSIDGNSFNCISKIPAAGNSNITKNYSFSDQNPSGSNNFYRIKIVDTDGKFSYSKVVAVKMNGKPSLQIFPNPARNILFLQASGQNENAVIKIVDIIGRTVKEEEAFISGNGSLSIDISKIQKGTYSLILQTQWRFQQQKFVKQ